MNSVEKEWYVIRVATNDEEKVKMFFERNGFETKVLYRELFRKKEEGTAAIRKLLFPGYIFVLSELDALEFDKAITDLRFKYGKYFENLKYDNEGTPALTHEEKRYLSHLAGDDEVVQTSVGFIEGDKVIITDGPLSGMESKIVYINRHKRIAKVEMDFMGEKRTITVPLEIVYKV